MMNFTLRTRTLAISGLVAALALSACNGGGSSVAPSSLQPASVAVGASNNGISRIKHFVIVYQENWSFDSLYGNYPGANGVGFGQNVSQADKLGNPLTSVPQPLDANGNPDSRFPSSLPVQTYDVANYVPAKGITGDIIHRFYHEQLQIDGGKMDKFVTWSDNGGLVLSEFDATNLPEGQLAQQNVLADNFFHSAFGGSFLNHQFLICACAPKWPNPPANYVSNPDPKNLNDAKVTPDGYIVNTTFATYQPHPAGVAASNLVPPLTNPTIADRLEAAGVSWKWYSGGWDDALAGHPDPNFQFHHQAFAYYAKFADGTAEKKNHLQDEKNFFADVQNGTLPDVTFIKPIGENNEHPGYSSLYQGQEHVADIVSAIRNSKYYGDTAIFVTYDENGGRWDHVAPPVIDRWGPGSRVPALVIAPFVRKGYVDHTQYETLSIIKTIEVRYGLKPLTNRDAIAKPMLDAFNFGANAQ